MASVSYLHPQLHSDDEPDPDDASYHRHRSNHSHHRRWSLTLDPYFPFFSSSSLSRSPNPLSPPITLREPTNFNLGDDDVVSDPGSVILNCPDPLDSENQVTFVMDLLQQRVEQSQVMEHSSHLVSDALNESDFGVIEENCELSMDNLELDLGLGFGLDSHENRGFQNLDGTYDNNGNNDFTDNIIIDDDDFFVERRVSGIESCEAESTVIASTNAIQIVGFGSDSGSEDDENSLALDLHSGDEYGLDNDDDDVSVTIPLCWDSLQLEDHRENNEDFEWEQVDGRVDEREVLSMFVDDEEASVSLSISPMIAPEDLVSVEGVGGIANVEWEVLLNANNLDSNLDHEQDHHDEPYFGDHVTAEYEMLFGQFAENDAFMGRPPASRSVVEKLASIVLTREDVESNNVICAVCKDDINVGERVKQLPCLHRYHGDCIVPWLGIRNTCPVCRYELPTDDVEYERRKVAQRSGRRL